MALEIVNCIVSPVAQYLIAPIGRQIGYVISYTKNIDKLKNQVKELTMEKERIQHAVERALLQGEKIEADVQDWLSNVDAIIEETGKLLEHEGLAKEKCFMGFCANPITRHQLSRKATKKSQVVVDFQTKGKFDGVSYPAPPQGMGVTPAKDYEIFESRSLVFTQIMEALQDSGVNMIGVYGLPGVGKTTLVKKVAEQVKVRAAKMFNLVLVATVSQKTDLRRVQGELADGLDFKLGAETIKGRADQLRARLKRENKMLVILDDVWEEIKLEEIGIPLGHENDGGCKILLTSRYQNVLSVEMGTQKDFHIEVLQSDEAWYLFDKLVGGVKDSNLQHIATEVAKRCECLPVLIAAVAKALKGKEAYAWKDALKQLSSFDNKGMHAKVYSALEFCFNRLEGDEIKAFFLLCGLLVFYSYSVEFLLVLCMGLGLFRHLDTVEEARNRMENLVSDLKASCLLLDGERDGEIRMHDLIREFAASIASRVDNVLAVEYGGELREWPEKNMLQRCTMMTFSTCDLPELPEILECPEMKLFLLHPKDRHFKIPELLFQGMGGLQVLDVTNVQIPSLPSSLKYLENLRTLSIWHCELENITLIGKLQALQVLCIVNSELVCLPREISKLTNLQWLELRRCPTLQQIAADVLSCLTKLEYLCMEDSFNQWELLGGNGERKNASLAELKHLSKLNSLDIHIPDSKMISKDLSFEKLERFRIFIGDIWDWSSNYGVSKTLKLRLSTSIQSEAGIKMLMKRTEDLLVSELKGVRCFLDDLDWEGFPQLKHLQLQNSPEVSSMGWIPGRAFPNLESLSLYYLTNLENIYHGQLNLESFSRLRIVKVEGCERLKTLFSFPMARGLLKLEEIEATNCKNMQEIVTKGSEDGVCENEEIKWIKLRSVTLQCLPKLTSICSNEGPGSSMTVLFNRKIVFLNLQELKLCSINVEKIWHNSSAAWLLKLTSLMVEDCENLKYIFNPFMAKYLTQLEKLEVSNCEHLEEIICTEQSREGETVSQLLFANLQLLKLKHLPKLKRFCTSNLIEFPSLKELCIKDSPIMKIFACSCLDADVRANDDAAETNPTLFDQKVLVPNLKELRIDGLNHLRLIWHDKLHLDSFSKLKTLEINNGKHLLKIFPPNDLRRFQNLETLEIENCDLVEEVFDLREETNTATITQLRNLDIRNLQSLKNVWNGSPQGILSFQNLHSMLVWYCPRLKNVFPASIALCLKQLELLSIVGCGVEEIVFKEKKSRVTPMFMFPKLTSVTLWMLSKLKRFYPETHNIECPALKKLSVYHCDKIQIFDFDLELRSSQVPSGDDQFEIEVEQPLFSFAKIIPNLEELALNSKEATMIKQDDGFPFYAFDKLKVLDLQCFHEESVDFPFDVVQRIPNMEKLVVSCSSFKQLFPSELVGVEEHAKTHLVRLRHLKLECLCKLDHIWNQTYPVDQLLPNLETLEVRSCDNLINFAPPTASFQNLACLIVKDCSQLGYLITSSTARSLVQLTTMSVRECGELKEIVAKEGEGAENEIIFIKLKSLTLHRLTSLSSFCSSNLTLKFPSLSEVIVALCPVMETFSEKALSTPMLQRVWLTEGKDKWQWRSDLNNTIQQLHTEAKA